MEQKFKKLSIKGHKELNMYPVYVEDFYKGRVPQKDKGNGRVYRTTGIRDKKFEPID